MAEADEAVEVRLPTRDDVPAIGELYRTLKGRPRPDAVTHQRLFDTPWGDSAALMAVVGDVCVGLVVFWPVSMRVGDELVLGAQATDAMTHPDYRRRRIFLDLLEALTKLGRDRGMELLYMFPNTLSVNALDRIGATYLGQVRAWTLDLRRRPSVLRVARSRRHDVVRGDPDLDELTALIAEAHRGADVIRIDKSRAWLSWRYAQPSSESYDWLTLRDRTGTLLAATLLGERSPELWGSDFAGIVRIHELFAVSVDATETLLRSAAAHVRSTGRRQLDALVKDPMLEQAVERAGFTSGQPRPVHTLALAPRAFRLDHRDFAAWRLIGGDLDFF